MKEKSFILRKKFFFSFRKKNASWSQLWGNVKKANLPEPTVSVNFGFELQLQVKFFEYSRPTLVRQHVITTFLLIEENKMEILLFQVEVSQRPMFVLFAKIRVFSHWHCRLSAKTLVSLKVKILYQFIRRGAHIYL